MKSRTHYEGFCRQKNLIQRVFCTNINRYDRIPLYAVLLLMLLSAFSCKPEVPQTKPLLLTSIHPYELILRQLAGSEFEVKSIIPAGASPHTWSPGPTDLKAFGDAQFILSNGLGLESSLEKNFATRAKVHVEAAVLLKDVLPLPKSEADEHLDDETEAEHHHESIDPHLWTSPWLMIRLVTHLEKELSGRFPNSAFVFKANAETMRKELETLTTTIESERRGYLDPGIITYHNSFVHFCEDFQIANLGWVQASPGKEPTPKELSALGNIITTNAVKALFLEPQMDKKAGEVLAREFGLKLLVLDPLGSNCKAATISELIVYNWNSMKQGFGKP